MLLAKHRVGVSFVARSSAEQIEPLHGFVPVDGMAVLVQGVSSGPRIDNVTIRGPFNATSVSSTPSRGKLFVCVPEISAEEAACATRIFANVARQAFRRPVSESDLAGALQFYEQGRAQGADFDGGIQKGLMDAALDHDADGNLIRKAGVMAIVLTGGEVRPGDAIRVEMPVGAHMPLQPV